MRDIAGFFNRPISSPRQLGIALMIAFMLAFAPQVVPNDWELNTRGLDQGTMIYENPDYVYPPWVLVLLMPYLWIGAALSRVLAGLAVIWLSYRRKWSLGTFLAIVANPFFVFSALFSNIDILVLLFPIVLWEASRGHRWSWLGQGMALLLLLIKPQGAFLVILFLFWMERENWRRLLPVVAVAAAVLIPTSLIGQPPLLLQWIDNISHPSAANQAFWQENNVSMTARTGLLIAVPLVFGTFALVYGLLRKRWTINHTYMVLLLGAMLVSPYTSSQSVIAALAFTPSWIATLLHYVLSLGAGALGIYDPFVPVWVLVFGVIALWFTRIEEKA